MTMSSPCRHLRLRHFVNGLPSIIAPNIEEVWLVGYPSNYSICTKLNSTLIGRIAAMTSLRSLELLHWQEWDDVKPLAALPLLTRLTCDQGLRLLADLLQPGCLQSLQVASVSFAVMHQCSASSNDWGFLPDMEKVAATSIAINFVFAVILVMSETYHIISADCAASWDFSLSLTLQQSAHFEVVGSLPVHQPQEGGALG